MSEEKQPDGTNPDVQHEKSDLKTGYIVGFGVFILVLIGVVMFGMFGLLGGLENRQAAANPTAVDQPRPTPPQPRLQPNPIDNKTAPEELTELRQREERRLNSYQWVDQEAGIITIPIGRAMEIIVEEETLRPY